VFFCRLATTISVKQFILTFSTLVLSFSAKGQTFHLGGDVSYYASYLLNKSIRLDNPDSTYALSGGYSGGLSGIVYFDRGGYYSRTIYGVNLEVNYSRVNQSLKVFPAEGAANRDDFYQFRYRLGYVDVPLLFVSCPSHHQGFSFEIGPQISFLTNSDLIMEESRVNPTPSIFFSKDQFRKVSFSGVIGIGCYYSFTEKFAIVGSFRAGYGFSDLAIKQANQTNYNPTHRLWGGVTIHAYYKINKYDSKKNRGYKYYLKQSMGK
jgi:hypothetical protein